MRVVVGAFLRDGGRVLLGRRSLAKREAPGCWDSIGGHVEAGESVEETLKRELMEELGVTPRSAEEIACVDVGDPAGAGCRLHLFVVDRWAGEVAMLGDEHVELGWFAPADAVALPDLADEGYRVVLRGLG